MFLPVQHIVLQCTPTQEKWIRKTAEDPTHRYFYVILPTENLFLPCFEPFFAPYVLKEYLSFNKLPLVHKCWAGLRF